VDILLESASEVIHSIDHHEDRASFLSSSKSSKIEIVLTNDCASIIFKHSIEFKRNTFPVYTFQSLSQLLLLLPADQMLILDCFTLHHRATRRPSSCLVLADKERVVLVTLPIFLETVVLCECSVLYFDLVLDLVSSRTS
jgi:hypothetical protein